MSQLFQSTFHTLTMDEAKIEIEDNPNIIIVDVRTPEEYQKGHIPGAIITDIGGILFWPGNLEKGE